MVVPTATDRPPRFIGLHFFSPVPVMGLIEIIRGLETGNATHEAARAFAADLGTTNVFGALTGGGCLHLLTRDQATDPEAFAAYLTAHRIDAM